MCSARGKRVRGKSHFSVIFLEKQPFWTYFFKFVAISYDCAIFSFFLFLTKVFYFLGLKWGYMSRYLCEDGVERLLKRRNIETEKSEESYRKVSIKNITIVHILEYLEEGNARRRIRREIIFLSSRSYYYNMVFLFNATLLLENESVRKYTIETTQ